MQDAIKQLHAGNLKALNAGLAYLGGLGIVPATVIREWTAAFGVPADKYLGVAETADAIEKANGDAKKSARGIYNRLHGPLSNFTVHVSGGPCCAVCAAKAASGGARPGPGPGDPRHMSPDTAAGILAADLALRAGRQHEHEKLLGYVRLRKPVSHKDRHMPGAVPPSLPPGPLAPRASASARARRAAELMS